MEYKASNLFYEITATWKAHMVTTSHLIGRMRTGQKMNQEVIVTEYQVREPKQWGTEDAIRRSSKDSRENTNCEGERRKSSLDKVGWRPVQVSGWQGGGREGRQGGRGWPHRDGGEHMLEDDRIYLGTRETEEKSKRLSHRRRGKPR